MSINKNNILDELKNSSIDEYDLKPLVLKAIRNDFSKLTNIYIDDSKINIDESIKQSVKSLYDRYVKAYDTLENAQLFYQFNDIKIGLNEINDIVEFKRYYQSSNHDIFFMLRYAINGVFDKDYHETILLEDTNKIGYSLLNFDIKIGGIRVKSFINGKIKIYGLTNEQKERIQKGFDIVKKYRNVTV